MVKDYDEPICSEDLTLDTCKAEYEEIGNDIRNLLDTEYFGVLSTQYKGQPYASLISFATTPNLKQIIFSTPRHTRKYRLLSLSKHVALLIDNRSQVTSRINQIKAVTATGKASIVDHPPEIEKWEEILLSKHPYLHNFLKNPSTALVVVDIYRYFYVRRFQEVSEWNPNPR